MGRKILLKRLCKCGCGRYTKWHKQNKKYNDYIHNHYWIGRKHSTETCKKMSNSRKGSIPWHKGRTGVYSKEVLERQRKVWTKERREWMSSLKKNRLISEETKRKISKAMLGNLVWNKGLIAKDSDSIYTGSDHPNWQGGKSFESYGKEFDIKLRELIRERDGYCCRICGVKQEKRKHAIHHIDYIKKNNDPINLITLCQPCHMKTNFDRYKWLGFFKEEVGDGFIHNTLQ